MKIGELAERSGLSTHTLRYYGKCGLLQPSGRSQNNYRHYSDADLSSALFIKRCKQSGFTLEETAALLTIKGAKDEHVCAEAKAITAQKIADISRQMEQLAAMKATLEDLSELCCGGSESAEFCSIIAKLEQQEQVTS
ncbi:heavy metal-responsive transcriptional regulator [Alteromonas oceanisediminis]|uniref:heavy metal-responsive transcriptional regulator n=1 Tax=Alteromonas oceanisediminis TaxID=2836180 RepID=UPI001BD9C4FE|nr:heavy metal-responsive transcriptional regulator [Alteromonas oceanisediminis]MBT0586273.1 heavy metal-responsive transcriptional regulator [Alteromonas oceanisediminis]